VIRIPGDRFLTITNTCYIFLFYFVSILDKLLAVHFVYLNPHCLRGLKNAHCLSVCQLSPFKDPYGPVTYNFFIIQ
jgi:hypothetical protein